MAQEINYAETCSEKIKDLLKSWDTGNNFQKFFLGDPGEIPTSDMPCIIVDKQKTHIKQGPTATDDVAERIQVIVVVNKKDYIDAEDDDTVTWKKKLELVVEGNNPVTFEYDPTTIVGVLRTNFTLGNFLLDQEMDINYGTTARNGIDDESVGEVHITIAATHYQATPSKV